MSADLAHGPRLSELIQSFFSHIHLINKAHNLAFCPSQDQTCRIIRKHRIDAKHRVNTPFVNNLNVIGRMARGSTVGTLRGLTRTLNTARA